MSEPTTSHRVSTHVQFLLTAVIGLASRIQPSRYVSHRMHTCFFVNPPGEDQDDVGATNTNGVNRETRGNQAQMK